MIRGASDGGLGEGVVLIGRGDAEGLAEALSEIHSLGVAAVVVLLASQTYASQCGDRGRHERDVSWSSCGICKLSGADVRVLCRESGVAGLSEVRGREAV